MNRFLPLGLKLEHERPRLGPGLVNSLPLGLRLEHERSRLGSGLVNSLPLGLRLRLEHERPRLGPGLGSLGLECLGRMRSSVKCGSIPFKVSGYLYKIT